MIGSRDRKSGRLAEGRGAMGQDAASAERLDGSGGARARLRDLIAERSVLRGGDFKLASGGQSSVFFDMKMTLLTPEGLDLTGGLVFEAVKGDAIAAIGGLVLGACPIVDAVCLKSGAAGQPITAFYVRKEPKEHGTDKLIEGPLAPGARVAVVEDVTTKGNSALKAAMAARKHGCEVVRVVTIVDRLEGARANLEANGLPLTALFTRDDFL
jgi:orotate phosphoribosyltransferase